MCDRFKIKLQQTTHGFDVLAQNQRLLIDNTAEQDLFALVRCYDQQRQIVKQLENQLKSVTLKTKSQSQQIQDQRQRRLNSSSRAARLHKTIQQIYDIINYRGQHTSPIDQLHYIKKLCEDKLREDVSTDDEDEDELDSRNCTIDDDQNESIIMHPRVVLPQSATKKRVMTHDDDDLSPPKRIRFEEPRKNPPPSQRIIAQTTFECFTSLNSSENTTRPFTVSTDIKVIDHLNDENQQRHRFISSGEETLSSSTINNSTTTASSSSSSIEQTLPLSTMAPSKMPTMIHRFISRKIFKPETCFVCHKRINFGSVSYRCSYCSQSCHVDCKENADSTCKTLTPNCMLPPRSPNVSTLKTAHRQRLICSEPRKATPITTASPRTPTIQRRLPFERMMLLKK